MKEYIFNNVFNETPPDNMPLAKAIWCYTIGSSVEWDEEENAYIVTVEEGSEEEGKDPVTVAIPLEGAQWIDKHICPYPLWSDKDRLNDARTSRKICQHALDEQNMELIAMFLLDTYIPDPDLEEDPDYTKYSASGVCDEMYVCPIT